MFSSLHPSPTSGDGKAIEQARYHYPTDPQEGHIRCALCGFQKDLNIQQEGDTLLSPGISYGVAQTLTVNLPVPTGAAPISFSYKSIEPSVVGGCPFCGTFNSRGALVGDPFDNGIDITNQ
jgi:hypothetical protein